MRNESTIHKKTAKENCGVQGIYGIYSDRLIWQMNKVFGVYSTKEKAQSEVWNYFKDKFELFDENYDADGEYIGCELIFKRVDEKYGGHALYGIDFHLETIDV